MTFPERVIYQTIRGNAPKNVIYFYVHHLVSNCILSNLI